MPAGQWSPLASTGARGAPTALIDSGAPLSLPLSPASAASGAAEGPGAPDGGGTAAPPSGEAAAFSARTSTGRVAEQASSAVPAAVTVARRTSGMERQELGSVIAGRPYLGE